MVELVSRQTVHCKYLSNSCKCIHVVCRGKIKHLLSRIWWLSVSFLFTKQTKYVHFYWLEISCNQSDSFVVYYIIFIEKKVVSSYGAFPYSFFPGCIGHDPWLKGSIYGWMTSDWRCPLSVNVISMLVVFPTIHIKQCIVSKNYDA